jgi:hypothetical protein
VPWDRIKTLAARTQSTAERQATYFDNKLPHKPGADWATTWGRTGEGYKNLGLNVRDANTHAVDLRKDLKNLDESLAQRWWQRWFNREDIARRKQKLLENAQVAQGDLRNSGRYIGQMRGTIAPGKGQVEQRFDPFQTMHDTSATPVPLEKPADLSVVQVMQQKPSIPKPAGKDPNSTTSIYTPKKPNDSDSSDYR